MVTGRAAGKSNTPEKRFGQRLHGWRQDAVCANVSGCRWICGKIIRHAQRDRNQACSLLDEFLNQLRLRGMSSSVDGSQDHHIVFGQPLG